MKNYGVFYSFTEEKEYLLILFSDDEITYQKSFEHVMVSYHDVDVVSYKIKGINKIMKIHADGLIPVLSKEFLKLISNKNIITYSVKLNADYMAKNIEFKDFETTFDVYKKDNAKLYDCIYIGR